MEERQAIWFQTQPGLYWEGDEEGKDKIYFDIDEITENGLMMEVFPSVCY